MMKKFVSLSFSALLISSPIFAGFPVIDPFNLAQNVGSLLTQYNQLKQTAARIKYEIDSAIRMKERLTKFNITDIDSLVSQIRSFRTRTRAISYTYKSISNQFDKMYGKKGQFSKSHKAWEKQSDDSIRDAMISQGLLDKSQKHMSDLDEIIAAKRESQGDAETLQTIGEINAIQSKQLADLSQIIASDARAKQSVLMEERSKNKLARERAEHLMKDFNVHSKSRPLAYFPSLGTTAPKVHR